MRGAPGWELEFAARDDECVVAKDEHDAFALSGAAEMTRAPLADALAALAPDTAAAELLVCGFTTNNW